MKRESRIVEAIKDLVAMRNHRQDARDEKTDTETTRSEFKLELPGRREEEETKNGKKRGDKKKETKKPVKKGEKAKMCNQQNLRRHIKKITLKKNRTNAANAILPLFKQPIGDI